MIARILAYLARREYRLAHLFDLALGQQRTAVRFAAPYARHNRQPMRDARGRFA